MSSRLATPSGRGRAVLEAIGFVLVALVVYARTLDGWFLSDDSMLGMVTPDGHHVAWGHVFRVFHMDWGERGDWAPLRYYRPLVVFSQALDAMIWGINPLGYHLTNVALHGLNGFLLHRIARALGAATATGLFAGALFVVYPWCPESVAWISGRTDVLATTATLSGLLAYLRARVASGRKRRFLLSGSLFFFVLGVLSKEAALPLSLMIVTVDLVSGFDFEAPWRSFLRVLPAWASFGAVSLAYLWWRSVVLGSVIGGDSAEFYRTREDWYSHFGANWGRNLSLLLSPFNREAVGRHAVAYQSLCVLAAVALAVGLGMALRARVVQSRVALTSVALFVASIAPFAVGIHIQDNLGNARYLYLPTVFFCLLIAALVSPAWERPRSVVPVVAILGVAVTLLMKNLTPWVEASDIMRSVTRSYVAAFGRYSGEEIEGLPEKHDGALMALYNASTISAPFVTEPPRPEAIVTERAFYSRLDRRIWVAPDPVAQASERLSQDRERAEWLLPIDGTELDAASLEQLVREGQKGGMRSFRATSNASWLIMSPDRQVRWSHLPRADEYAYVLIRPQPETAPNLFWTNRDDEQFGDPRFVQMRPELVVSNGGVVPRRVEDFYVYAYPLHEAKHWPGMDRVKLLRLDPHFTRGTFDIAFFGISRYLPPEAE